MIKMDLETKIALTIEIISIVTMIILIDFCIKRHDTEYALYGTLILFCQLTITFRNLKITRIDDEDD